MESGAFLSRRKMKKSAPCEMHGADGFQKAAYHTRSLRVFHLPEE